MTYLVIYLFKLIQIYKKNRCNCIRIRPPDNFGKMLIEQGTIRQTGEHIVGGLVGQLLHHLVCLCNIGNTENHPLRFTGGGMQQPCRDADNMLLVVPVHQNTVLLQGNGTLFQKATLNNIGKVMTFMFTDGREDLFQESAPGLGKRISGQAGGNRVHIVHPSGTVRCNHPVTDGMQNHLRTLFFRK